MDYGGGRIIVPSRASCSIRFRLQSVGHRPKMLQGAAIHLHIHNRGHKRAVPIGSGRFFIIIMDHDQLQVPISQS